MSLSDADAAAVRILVANDDGVSAPGLRLLADAARSMSPDVWIVAPERKWTAASHQLTFDREQTLTRVAERTYACSGAPADCVVAAMTIVLPGDSRPQLVLAGINDKRNVGEDIAYSGTSAIAREAAFWGIPAVSLSRAGPAIEQPGDREFLTGFLRRIWASRTGWVQDGHWLGINLPAALPAPVVEPRVVGRDKIGSACDVLETTEDRITYKLRRGRPGMSAPGLPARDYRSAEHGGYTTSAPGDENSCLAGGAITVLRFCWHTVIALPAGIVAGWQAGGKITD